MPSTRLIFGCGYLGQRVAKLWQAAGDTVHAVTRSPERASDWKSRGISPLVADILQPATLTDLPAADTILFAVGYDRTSGVSIDEVYVQGLRNVLAALPNPPRQFVYISSTGVYGQASGDAVNEDSPCVPLRAGGKACLAAEEVLRHSPLADRAMILRLAGIYGPGRIPRVNDLLAGQEIDAPATGTLNLIHVADAARIVVAAVEQLSPPRLYVVSDGQPVVRSAYYNQLAALVGAPPPRFIAPAVDSPAAARAASDKAIDPRKLYSELRISLAYPGYREGLAELVQ